MIRFLIATALLATPAFADDSCRVPAGTAQTSSPIVETSSLLEALQQQPLSKRPRRVTESFHRALVDSTDVALFGAWTSIPELDEALEDEGVFNGTVAAAMVERRMKAAAGEAQQDIESLSLQMHHVRRDYAAVLQAMRELAAERPKRQPIVSQARSYFTALFFGEAAQPSTWQRNQLIRREALRAEKGELVREIRELTNLLTAAMADRSLHEDAADDAARIGCALQGEELPTNRAKTTQY